MALPAGRYGVTKNQLLKIKKLPMNTIKLIEELTEKFNLLGSAAFKNSTSVVTQSTDLVESGAVKDIVGWGNKNLLNQSEIVLGSIDSRGEDTTSDRRLRTPFIKVVPLNTYALSCNNNSFWVFEIHEYSSSKTWLRYFAKNTNTAIYQASNDAQYIKVLYKKSDNSACYPYELTQPQIEKGSEVTEYEPYHASVDESKADNSVIGAVEDGATASQAYAVGEHFIRDGAFCTVTQAISSGGTLTEGTNYTSGNVAELITSKAITINKNGLIISAAKFGKIVIITINNGTCTDPISANDSLVSLSDFGTLFKANDKFLIPSEVLDTYGKTLRIYGASSESSVKVRENVSAGTVIRLTFTAILI